MIPRLIEYGFYLFALVAGLIAFGAGAFAISVKTGILPTDTGKSLVQATSTAIIYSIVALGLIYAGRWFRRWRLTRTTARQSKG